MKKQIDHCKNMPPKTVNTHSPLSVDGASQVNPAGGEKPCGDCDEFKGEWHCTMNCWPRSVRKQCAQL